MKHKEFIEQIKEEVNDRLGFIETFWTVAGKYYNDTKFNPVRQIKTGIRFKLNRSGQNEKMGIGR